MTKLIYYLNKHKINISKIYYCPHHPKAKLKKFKLNCKFRKPKTGMIKKAIFDLDQEKNSKHYTMIGNEISDKLLAKNSKIKYIDQSLLK